MTRLSRLLWTLLALTLAVAVSRLLQPYLDEINIAMVYLLAVVIVAFLLGMWPAIATALLGILLFDFINLPPYFVLTGHAVDYLFTLGVMLITAITISTLAGKLHRQVATSELRRRRTAALYELATELAGSHDTAEIHEITRRHMERTAGIQPVPAEGAQVDGHREHLLAMEQLAANALERNALRDRANESELRAQRESLRSSILGAVSHDLKTPLATIIGASSSLLGEGDGYAQEDRRKLRALIFEEAMQMQRMVENLLDMARLSSGSVEPRLEWQAFEEIVGSALATLRRRIQNHDLQIGVPADLPLIRCDGVLMERVLVNLVENAARYSPPETAIRIEMATVPGHLLLRVQDQGPGIPEELREQVFEPFFQTSPSNAGGGLGLSICRGIVAAHQGSIRIDAAAGGGTVVTVSLPVPPDTPRLAQIDEEN